MATRLTIEFKNLCRPPEYVSFLQNVFADAMRDYHPNIERLAYLQQRGYWEYIQAKQRGIWAVTRYLTIKERLRVVPIVRFEND